MYIRVGNTRYGEVETADDGEHAVTMFTHIWYVPLVPGQSYWIGPDGRETKIEQHHPSLRAGYARSWSIAAAMGLIALAAGLRNPWVALGAPVLLLLALQSWRGRHASAHQLRAGVFHRAAYGLRCDPRYIPADRRALLAKQIEERWAALGNNRSPDDVARDGARDAVEAMLAYMMLRLAGLKLRGDAARDHEREAARLLEGDHASNELEAGPFRGLSDARAPSSGTPAPLPSLPEVPVAPRMPAPVSRGEEVGTALLVYGGAALASILGGGLVAMQLGDPRSDAGVLVCAVLMVLALPGVIGWKLWRRQRRA